MNKYVQQILDTIDPVTPHIAKDFHEMTENFDIYEWLNEEDTDELIKYQTYHSWICTDSEVGIKIWYFENEVCAISIQWYRKSDIEFYWRSKNVARKAQEYIQSLCDLDYIDYTLWDSIDIDLVRVADDIDYKKCEVKNYKPIDTQA